jgi:N-acyl-D-aspartate/D-glutamate deacylase
MSALLPEWAYVGGPDELVKRMKSLSLREQARAEIEAGKTIFRALGWDRVLVVESEVPGRAGKTVADISREEGKDEFATAFDLLRDEPQLQCVLFAMDEDDVRNNLCGPYAVVGSDAFAMKTTGPLSYGKPHPRTYGAFPRILSWLVREQGALSLEEAVHRMTGKPAGLLGLSDRGVIDVGKKADLVLFDPKTVRDTATFEGPHSYPEGIRYIMVNGVLAVDPDGTRPASAGQVLVRG